jgi:uncharacterized membrane protein YeiH
VRLPVFWISDQTYLILALATTMLTFFAVRRLRLLPQIVAVPDFIWLYVI